jgi:penicillin-insensitive murein endopeptidase
MRRGLAAAVLLLSTLLARPVAAEPVDDMSSRVAGPASAAAAAAKAAKAAALQSDPQAPPAETAGQTLATAPETAPPAAEPPAAVATTAEPATAEAEAALPQHSALPEGPPVPLAVPPRSTADETPAESGASADAPPPSAQQAAATAAPEPTAAPAAPSPPAVVEPSAQPATQPADKPRVVAAKTLFGAAKEPAPMAARAIGTYARGCLSGAKPLAVDGPTWQAMRLSRNRTWGHPDLIALLEKFAGEVKQDGWPGLLVGDISQPRGGPMLTGHASHQLGLDADIWFTPMPDRRLSKKERETLSATSMLASDSLSVDPKVWTESRVKIIKRISSYSKVERVLVHPAIKKALCQGAGSDDRAWLNKVRPYWGHFYHFHVRIGCPAGSPGCKAQAPVPGDDGCGKELDDWYQLLTRKPKPRPPGEPKIVKPVKPRAPVTLADLPADCSDVLASGRDIALPPRTATPVAASATGGSKTKPPSKGNANAGKPAAAKPSAAPAPAKKPTATKAAASEKTKKQ